MANIAPILREATNPPFSEQSHIFCDLLIIDEMLPCDFSPFRTLEYSHHLSYYGSSLLVSTEGWHSSVSNLSFDDHLAKSTLPDAVKSRIRPYSEFEKVIPRLAYITFLHNAWQIFPHLTERKIPFILQLYPGGRFELNVEESDAKLRKLCQSPLCRKIIVTQNISYNYLIEKIGCDASKIEFIYGGVYDTRHDFDFMKDKQFYGGKKKTIDICFVAHRYGDDVKKKGYDQFVAVARALAPVHAHLRFHVIGDYTPDQLPLDGAVNQMIFHGSKPNDFFKEFYPTMDIILSANRPSNENVGTFDGFPTGACMEAGFRGVLNCISDPLKLNVAFTDNVDVLIVDFETETTVARISKLISEPTHMYRLAYANWKKFIEVFDTDRQLWNRCRIISNELFRVETLVVRPSSQPRFDGRAVIDAVGTHNEQLLLDLRDTERRHDNLLMEYHKLSRGFEEVRAEKASIQVALQKEFQDAAGLVSPLGRLEEFALRLLRIPIVMKLRAAYSRLARKIRRSNSSV